MNTDYEKNFLDFCNFFGLNQNTKSIKINPESLIDLYVMTGNGYDLNVYIDLGLITKSEITVNKSFEPSCGIKLTESAIELLDINNFKGEDL
jgi:hypothetical protein